MPQTSSPPVRALVWGENVHEQKHPEVREIYPQGMHHCLADGLSEAPDIQTRCATLQEPEHGLTEQALAETDVLVWWGHAAHGQVADAVVERVARRVWEGMGLIALHSAHYSKIFKRLMGTSCSLTWREAGEKERVWVCQPGHPITAGLDPYFQIEHEEMYGEPFGIPNPEELIFLSWFEGGEVFRSGCTWRRGQGRIFYFRPGHETYPTYHHPQVKLVLKNAVRWARLQGRPWIDSCPNVPASQAPEPLEIKGPRLHQAGEPGLR